MYDGTEQDLLRLLASRAGISPDFHDIAGILHVTSDETTRAILSAMGFRVDSRDALAHELTTWDEAVWRQPCDPILILQQGYDDVRWVLRLLLEPGDEHRLVVSWQLTDEKGTIIHRAEAGPPLVPQAEQVVAGSPCCVFSIAAVSRFVARLLRPIRGGSRREKCHQGSAARRGRAVALLCAGGYGSRRASMGSRSATVLATISGQLGCWRLFRFVSAG